MAFNPNQFTQGGSGQVPEPDKNQVVGTDQFGNPINIYGLPPGQSPPRTYTPPQGGQAGGSGDSGLSNVPWEGFGDEMGKFWGHLGGENTYRPQVGAPSITAPVMTAAQMTAAGMDTGQADVDRSFSQQARDSQSNLGQALMDRALGRGGPSVAELQMQRGIGQAQQAAARQAASARGVNRGLASYGAINAGANLAAQGVQDAAALRAGETIAAQNAAGRVFADQRMQDLTSRGMSIQQAQAIMDAENRAREANMNATNQARQTNVQSNLTAGQANLQADTAARGMTTQITEGEATRKQKRGAGILAAFGLSDINAKQNVQPLLYSGQLAPQAQTNEPSVAEQARNLEQDRKLGAALTQMGNRADVSQVPATTYPAYQAPEIEPYEPPAQQPQSGGGIGDIIGGLVSLSDKEAKQDAFEAGIEAALSGGAAGAKTAKGTMGKAKLSSMPLFEVSPERADRMGRLEIKQADARLDQRRALADAEELWRQRRQVLPLIDARLPTYGPPAPPAPAPAPVPAVPLAQAGTSDKRAKSYGYSDKRSKELESENEMLKSALSKLGGDVSGTPTASYPELKQPDFDALDAADAARNANPPPPYSYRYKPEFAEKQGTDTDPRLGIMAQDALKSPMYRPAVVKMPDGMLGIDQNRLLHANTAMLSGEHERINQVEEQNRKLAEALQRMGDRKEAEILGEDEALSRALGRMGNERARDITYSDKRTKREIARDRYDQEYVNEVADSYNGDLRRTFDHLEGTIPKKDRARRYLRSQVAPRVEFFNGLRTRDDIGV